MKNFNLGLFTYMMKEVDMKCMSEAPAAGRIDQATRERAMAYLKSN